MNFKSECIRNRLSARLRPDLLGEHTRGRRGKGWDFILVHKPSGRLPLLPVRPTVSFPAIRHCCLIRSHYLWQLKCEMQRTIWLFVTCQDFVALQTELRTLEKLRHPHIVQYYGYKQSDDGSLAIFMEYMPGVSKLFTCFWRIFIDVISCLITLFVIMYFNHVPCSRSYFAYAMLIFTFQ